MLAVDEPGDAGGVGGRGERDALLLGGQAGDQRHDLALGGRQQAGGRPCWCRGRSRRRTQGLGDGAVALGEPGGDGAGEDDKRAAIVGRPGTRQAGRTARPVARSTS